MPTDKRIWLTIIVLASFLIFTFLVRRQQQQPSSSSNVEPTASSSLPSPTPLLVATQTSIQPIDSPSPSSSIFYAASIIGVSQKEETIDFVKRDEICPRTTTTTSSSKSTNTRRKIWKPCTCNSRWNFDIAGDTNSIDVFLKLNESGFRSKRITQDNSRNIGEFERCVAYDSGVFVDDPGDHSNGQIISSSSSSSLPISLISPPHPIEKNNSNSNKETTIPTLKIYSLHQQRSATGLRSPRILSKNQIGSNLVSYIAKSVRLTKSQHQENNIEFNALPPWILFIGDSRVRQLLLRLIEMIRSEFVPSSNNNNIDDEDSSQHLLAAAMELRRAGLIEHYFHCNATYTVYGDEEQDSTLFAPTSDRLRVLERDQNCDSDPMSQVPPPGKRILFRICFWWNSETDVLNRELKNVVANTLQNNVHSILWMLTAHECQTGKTVVDAKTGNKFQVCDSKIRNSFVTETMMKIMGDINHVGKENSASSSILQNFAILSTPLHYREDVDHQLILERNKAVLAGINRYLLNERTKRNLERVRRRTEKKATIANDESYDEEDFLDVHDSQMYLRVSEHAPTSMMLFTEVTKIEKESSRKNISLLQSVKNQSKKNRRVLNFWYLDIGTWWRELKDVEKLPLCDQIHTMCGFKPIRDANDFFDEKTGRLINKNRKISKDRERKRRDKEPAAASELKYFCNLCRDAYLYLYKLTYTYISCIGEPILV